MRLVKKDKTVEEIAVEWDALAELRYEQIKGGFDITFDNVMVPIFRSFVEDNCPSFVLDAGCGTGALTNALSKFCQIIGIDPSRKSIEIANREHPNIKFVPASIEEFSIGASYEFDLIIANMVVMDTLDITSFLKSAAGLLRERGLLLATLTHPWFWPEYYGYSHQKWFRYEKELVVEAPFKISLQPSNPHISTHVHRPLGSYFKSFKEKFDIIEFGEIMPSMEVQSLYGRPWDYPRYCKFLLQKSGA